MLPCCQGVTFGFGLCLDLPYNNQYWGAKLWFYTCNGSAAQNWSTPYY